jgi:pantoate--beta-alanine ligase
MKVIRTVAEMKAWRAARPPGRRVALVPTMGFLHQGHLSLMREARRQVPEGEGDVVISIFVNPTQFGPNEDLDVYPRDEEGDLAKAEQVGVDVAFCPLDPKEMLPEDANTWVYVDALQDVLCGASRPNHFRGVCTVCTKLWNIVRPDVSVYGEKDYQQLTILRRMHRDLHLSGEIVGGPIVREADGLAMSSRNANLSAQAREDALAISKLLSRLRERIAGGECEVAGLLDGVDGALAPGEVDYVQIRDAEDLGEVERIEGPVVCAVAAWFGGVRLIDNVVVAPG